MKRINSHKTTLAEWSVELNWRGLTIEDADDRVNMSWKNAVTMALWILEKAKEEGLEDGPSGSS
jgi:hypothetical protein